MLFSEFARGFETLDGSLAVDEEGRLEDIYYALVGAGDENDIGCWWGHI